MDKKQVLVVGGGIEGIQAALEKAGSGSRVTILEKFPTLGGERIPRDRLIKTVDDAFVNPDLEYITPVLAPVHRTSSIKVPICPTSSFFL